MISKGFKIVVVFCCAIWAVSLLVSTNDEDDKAPDGEQVIENLKIFYSKFELRSNRPIFKIPVQLSRLNRLDLYSRGLSHGNHKYTKLSIRKGVWSVWVFGNFDKTKARDQVPIDSLAQLIFDIEQFSMDNNIAIETYVVRVDRGATAHKDYELPTSSSKGPIYTPAGDIVGYGFYNLSDHYVLAPFKDLHYRDFLIWWASKDVANITDDDKNLDFYAKLPVAAVVDPNGGLAATFFSFDNWPIRSAILDRKLEFRDFGVVNGKSERVNSENIIGAIVSGAGIKEFAFSSKIYGGGVVFKKLQPNADDLGVSELNTIVNSLKKGIL